MIWVEFNDIEYFEIRTRYADDYPWSAFYGIYIADYEKAFYTY